MKKVCTGVLAVLTAFSMCLAGCEADKEVDIKLDPEDPTAIEIWHYYNGQQLNSFNEMVTEFNETVGMEQGIIVEAFSQGNVNELITKVADAANQKVGSGEVPDMFACYADTAYEIDKLGLLADLSPYFTKEELDEYVPSYIEEGRFDESGSLKIFPTAKSVEVMMLNKTDWDRFATAEGVDLSQLETVEGVVRTAKQYYEWTDSLTPESNDGKAFFGRDAMANYMIIGCKQLGTEIFDIKDESVQLNVNKNVIRKLWNNYYIPYICGYFGAYGNFRSDDAKTGDIIALVGSTSGAAYFPEMVTVNDGESYPIEALSLPIPVFEGGEKYNVQQGAGMAVVKSDEKKEYAAVQFLKWFTEKERNVEFSISSGYLPVKRGANTEEYLQQILAIDGIKKNISANLLESLPVAFQSVRDFKLYTNKAFKNGNDARNILEHSMQDQADADREKVIESLKDGLSLEEAASSFTTDQYFDSWYNQFVDRLTSAMQ
ncbi:extracellular solute-binding protein [Clostridiaceae bacterium NSJ-33]|uniref:Extracellular solute-binding protein n=2 Tax=Fumia xinanensis TaxID=2763659 RepID=A0A926E2G1_9FIRM|nr:extracellular solute-binding protein [Fumia xinanensis]PWL47490.1 MAG: ABC transporter substrate-binding protein [Clostridiales bacterium]